MGINTKFKFQKKISKQKCTTTLEDKKEVVYLTKTARLRFSQKHQHSAPLKLK